MSKVKMEAPTSSISDCDDDKRDLELLLDAFGSMVSLEDIASAYCQAGRNICDAGEILCNLQGSTSSASTYASKDESKGLSLSSELSDDILLDESNFPERNSIASKQKKCSVSMGTVSSVIGKEYAQSRPSRSVSCRVNKALKLNSGELPISEICEEKVPPNMTTIKSMHKDIEEFLFKMLGDGFQLDMKIIQEVLGRCGYDVERSMEKLLDLSASTLEKSDDVSGILVQKPMEKYSDTESISCQEKLQCIDSARSGKAKFISRNESTKSHKDRYDLQREVLEALFNVPERFEEEPKRNFPVKDDRRSRGFGRVVVEPLRDTTTEHKTAIAKLLVNEEDENEEDEDSYQVLRKAVKEHWITMKEYYKASVDAFAKGDPVRAYKLLEEGNFFKEKAREADEKSAQKFLETRREDEMSLDLHEYDPKEAIRLLRVHLTSLSGISSIRYLKVIVGADTEDSKEAARKRLILKLLEKESIKWSEEANGRAIVIRLDEINPKHLSFAKNQ
ncbi:putative nuclear RNA export factor SDE5 isoform X2 [Camellia sinensis]|uniref:putative nuclear RNA export factor SDE5 isoform X2 n=1 Tax=Camellia sinensis TaxID=4442 RepID=UPI0010366F79|nr:putative nuclear RNA export factor SDE5 isoform X2 [Camellia sinensis]